MDFLGYRIRFGYPLSTRYYLTPNIDRDDYGCSDKEMVGGRHWGYLWKCDNNIVEFSIGLTTFTLII